MQIFELHFNPRNRQDILFDTFSYPAQTLSEKRLGSLFLAGYLTNASLESPRFLKNLARVVKSEYYQDKKSKPEKQLKEGLKKGNYFLEQMAQKGKVGWISNLNFAVLSLSNDFKLNFAKVGLCKILLLRKDKIAEIGPHLELIEIEPYPLKVFSKAATGTLKVEDRILVMNSQIYEHFSSYQLVEKIVQEPNLNQRKLNQIFKKAPQDIPGFFLLIDLKKKEGKPRKVVLKKETPLPLTQWIPFFSIKTPVVLQLKYPLFFKKVAKKIIFSLIRAHCLFTAKLPALVFFFLFLLLLGGILAEIEEKSQIAQTQNQVRVIEEKLARAEAIRAFNKEEALDLFSEVWQDLEVLPKESLVRPELEKKFLALNHLEKINAPEVFLEFEKNQSLPEQIFLVGQSFYFMSHSPTVLIKEKDHALRALTGKSKLITAFPWKETILFLSESNQLLRPEENGLVPVANLNFSSALSSSFNSHLYLVEEKTGEILKYPYEENFSWYSSLVWLRSGTEKIKPVQSMAIDGRVWILSEDNTIYSYFKGEREKKFEVRLFPLLGRLTKIYTSSLHEYLYLLEPEGKRVMILSKEGQLIRQYQSEQFDNLKDLVVSEDEKTIYLLNGAKVYQAVTRNR